MKRDFDERIIETKRKISARACHIMLWGILVVTLYRQLYLKQEFSDYGDYFVIWLIASLYIAFGEVLQGVDPFGGNRYKYLLVPLIMAGSVLAVQIYMGTVVSLSSGLISFVIAFIASSATLYGLYLLYCWWEKKNIGDE